MRHPRRVPDGTPHSPNPLLGVAVVHLIITYTSTVITVPGPAEPPPDLRDVSKPNAPQFAKLALDPRAVGTHRLNSSGHRPPPQNPAVQRAFWHYPWFLLSGCVSPYRVWSRLISETHEFWILYTF